MSMRLTRRLALALALLVLQPLAGASDGQATSADSRPAAARDISPPPSPDALEVELYPTPAASEGYLIDGIIRTRQGIYLLYTGWFFHDIRSALTKPYVPVCCNRPRR